MSSLQYLIYRKPTGDWKWWIFRQYILPWNRTSTEAAHTWQIEEEPQTWVSKLKFLVIGGGLWTSEGGGTASKTWRTGVNDDDDDVCQGLWTQSRRVE